MSADVGTNVFVAEWGEEALARLRAAVARGDGDAGLEVLRGRPLGPVLQYAGDVALEVMSRGLIEGVRLAGECRAELAERGLPGDAELAAQLEDPVGSVLFPLPVDLGAVAAAMDEGFHVLDVERGDVLPVEELPEGLPIAPDVLPEGEEARRGWARRWLAEQGFRPVPRGL